MSKSFLLVALFLSMSICASADPFGYFISSSGAKVHVEGADNDGVKVVVRGTKGEATSDFYGKLGPGLEKFWYKSSDGSKIVGTESDGVIHLKSTSSNWKASWKRPDAKAVADRLYSVHKALQEERGSQRLIIERLGPTMLETQLHLKLLEVSNNGPGEGKWLDFDIFANGQMNAAEYRLGEPKVQGDTVRIPVEISFRRPGHLIPRAELELQKRGGSWWISNIHYPGEDPVPDWDLKTWLEK